MPSTPKTFNFPSISNTRIRRTLYHQQNPRLYHQQATRSRQQQAGVVDNTSYSRNYKLSSCASVQECKLNLIKLRNTGIFLNQTCINYRKLRCKLALRCSGEVCRILWLCYRCSISMCLSPPSSSTLRNDRYGAFHRSGRSLTRACTPPMSTIPNFLECLARRPIARRPTARSALE